MTQTLLSLRGITKRYPSVVANDGVSLDVKKGEIHAILGENGAGKSTLMKIIYGAVKADEGSIFFNGQATLIKNPQEARQLGISMVFQHFSLFDTLSVAENVWLGLERTLSLDQVTQKILETASNYGLDIDPKRPVYSLSVGEMQRVEIIRSLLNNPQLLILDEPTSVLTPQAVDKLFVVLNQLASEGKSILYISHKLHEIRALCSACTVMRAGVVTGSCNPKEESNASLSQLMIGSMPPSLSVRPQAPGVVALSVRELTLNKSDPFGVDLRDITLQVKCGEIVGVAGVSGNGQQELLYALSGENTLANPGSITLFDQAVGNWAPEERRALGLHFVPEERLGRGAVPELSLSQNLLLTRKEAVSRSLGWLNMQTLDSQASKIIERFQVKTSGPSALAKSLSGGNLQKFLVGREIDASPRLLIISQPTWGVDIGASAQIRAAILALRDAGCAVLVVSEELDELLELSDRLHVIANGALSPSLSRQEANVSLIGTWMSGLWPSTHSEVSHAAS
jgi:simple sugar transport system ATP-binding protein